MTGLKKTGFYKSGSLPEGIELGGDFDGFSIPRNKERMRIFKDMEMFEQLGSGIPRILEHYRKECFHFILSRKKRNDRIVKLSGHKKGAPSEHLKCIF